MTTTDTATPPPAETPVRGHVGEPITDDEAVRGLERVGVIDVGSNSVRMVVFDGAARSPAYFFNEKILCGLGRGLAETNRLHPEGRSRALAAITRFALLAVFGAEPLLWESEAAAHVWECALEEAEGTVSRFVQRGLVVRRDDQYWTHVLLADYAAEMLETL